MFDREFTAMITRIVTGLEKIVETLNTEIRSNMRDNGLNTKCENA